MGKSTISMAIFNSYVKLPEGKPNESVSGSEPRNVGAKWDPLRISAHNNWIIWHAEPQGKSQALGVRVKSDRTQHWY